VRADLGKQPREVAAMFDGVASRYDRTNTILSFGQDRLWRRATRHALELELGDRVLDLAAGTGVSTDELTLSGARPVGVDISLGMLRAGLATRPTVTLIAGDALALPFRDGAFDAVTISFGLRNVHDTDAALRELARVTRPGGRMVVCEFSHPVQPAFRAVYLEYLMRALPAVAQRVASNPEAYVYLAESIRAWPDQPSLARRIGANGWEKVAWRNLSGGIVALHRARRAG
jgi:demethylmenaquinone methyltransferase / 2-methoxy-6-polyprenyl-1,4-benzoquinol methylase